MNDKHPAKHVRLSLPKKKKFTLPKLPIVAMLRNTCLDHNCAHGAL